VTFLHYLVSFFLARIAGPYNRRYHGLQSFQIASSVSPADSSRQAQHSDLPVFNFSSSTISTHAIAVV